MTKLDEIGADLASLAKFPPMVHDTPVDFGEKMLRISQIQFELCKMMAEWLAKS